MTVPLLSLGSSTVRSNPLQSTSSHCNINRSSWPNKTEISEKKYKAIRDQRNSNIFHGYKKIWLIINSKFIRSQQTHCKKSYIIWISKRPLYWESNESEEAPPGALVGCAPLGAPPRCCLGPLGVFWSKKISVKFCCIWTPFGIDFLQCKKHAKNNNWHLALCQ